MVESKCKELFGRGIKECTNEEVYATLLQMVKEMAERKACNGDAAEGKEKSGKKVYYVSAEFLIGKLLSNNMINLGIYEDVKKELDEQGKSLADIEEIEAEPSLGNGGDRKSVV